NASSLSPTVVHTGASLNPTTGTAQDFTNPVTYRVTAADGSTKDYIVTVTVATIPVTGVSVTPISRTITEGNTQTLTATITPSNASNTS
ncbi:Ig-like domain-containing protein, partial [uncultured Maribacter sp.]|uniref:Ig-like domain-containing protein n=1 Tax=uncultured Maribacter sp. TaxID=431308 RepID=UPI0026033487